MSQHFNQTFSLKNRFKSFRCAVKGLQIFFTTQHNAWIELLATIIVMVLGIEFKISHQEWFELIVAFAIVFVAEILNTAIEYLTDMVSPNYHVEAGNVKDIASASVLIATITSLLIGTHVFYNYVI